MIKCFCGIKFATKKFSSIIVYLLIGIFATSYAKVPAKKSNQFT